ncbi:uncharacterized protein LOC133545609 [Nerophis ophidion]|uniref:uncharacterized protein LOC133545609 n=1 Tax=Nerophis ophidion TaxID=159077 RepID=UPI002ADFBE85|nr:uncharacterized protein LOC133545609 [Nerophis ophidion]
MLLTWGSGVVLMLLLLILAVQRAVPGPSCPASCVLCSDKAVICHRLAGIIEAPETTEALLLTEGSIAAVQSGSFLALSDITVIGLSHNRISALGEQSFRNLPFLHTLLLDHNLLTSQALQEEALTGLARLQVLALGHNHLSKIQADWFQGTSALRSLKLEGNRITGLDAGSLPLNGLKDLESLDLSDNLISHLDRKSFRGLVRLHHLDLSRNRLSSAASQAFSYLSWLTDLNLDLNSWNCTCQLLDLAAFLSAFIQQPDKILYNGQRMLCVSADNPSVSTVLELTQANCVASNQNISVQVETRDSVTAKIYARDLAITAVLCFIGGIALTLLVVLIYYQLSRRKKVPESQNLRGGSGTVANCLINNHDLAEKQRQLFLQAHQLLDSETLPWHGGQFDGKQPYFMCADCHAHPWDERMSDVTHAERTLRMEAQRRRLDNQQDDSEAGIPRNFLPAGSSMTSSGQWTDMSAHKPDEHTNDEVTNRRCKSCHRTFRQSTLSRIHSNGADPALFDGSRVNPLHVMNNIKPRNVTFDLQSSKRWQKERNSRARAMKRGQERGVEKDKRKSSRMQKAKINLNPLRKSKVHPKRKNEQHSRSSEKEKGKDKRKDGKESEEMEDKERSCERLKESRNKPSKGGALSPGDKKQEGGKMLSGSVQKIQNKAEGDKEATQEGSTDVTTTGTQVASTSEQGPNIPAQQVALVLASSHLSQQPLPFSVTKATNHPVTERNRSLLLSPTTPVGSPLVQTGLSNSAEPDMLISRADLALDGSEDILRRDSLVSPVANTAHADLLQSSVSQRDPLQLSQPGGPGTNIATDSSHIKSLSQSHLDLASASLEAGSKSNPTLVQSPQTGESSFPIASGSEPQSLVLPIQAPQSPAGLSALTSPIPMVTNTVENLVNSNVQAGKRGVAENLAVGMSAGVRLGIEGQAGSEGSTPTAEIPAQGAATPGTSPLIKHEYLSGEGGSSSRRKLKLVLPEKTSGREPTALERKIR